MDGVGREHRCGVLIIVGHGVVRVVDEEGARIGGIILQVQMAGWRRTGEVQR